MTGNKVMDFLLAYNTAYIVAHVDKTKPPNSNCVQLFMKL